MIVKRRKDTLLLGQELERLREQVVDLEVQLQRVREGRGRRRRAVRAVIFFLMMVAAGSASVALNWERPLVPVIVNAIVVTLGLASTLLSLPPKK